MKCSKYPCKISCQNVYHVWLNCVFIFQNLVWMILKVTLTVPKFPKPICQPLWATLVVYLFHYKVNNLIKLVLHPWWYSFECLHFRIKSMNFFDIAGCSN